MAHPINPVDILYSSQECIQFCIALLQILVFLNVFAASQSEITRRLEKSSLKNDELDGEDKGFLSRSEITHDEHPLSLGKTSIWNQFFQVKSLFLNFYCFSDWASLLISWNNYHSKKCCE